MNPFGDLTKKLSEPFSVKDLEWRIQSQGQRNGEPWARVVAYVQSRAIMKRLDNLVGAENWRNEYTPVTLGQKTGFLCGLSIKFDGQWVTKWDGAEVTAIEAVKGGISGALKRAAVCWGIGRYLYGLDEAFAQIVEKNTRYPGGFAEYGCVRPNPKKNESFQPIHYHWIPPALPDWAVIESEKHLFRRRAPDDGHEEQPGAGGQNARGRSVEKPQTQQSPDGDRHREQSGEEQRSGAEKPRQNASAKKSDGKANQGANAPPAQTSATTGGVPQDAKPSSGPAEPDGDQVYDMCADIIRSCGSRTVKDANTIIAFVTGGKVTTVDAVKANGGQAVALHAALKKACQKDGGATLLVEARKWLQLQS